MCKMESADKENDALNRPQDLKELDCSLWNDKCDFIDIESCTNLNQNNYNLLVIQFNIRSLLAHQHELKQLLQTVEKKTLETKRVEVSQSSSTTASRTKGERI